MLYATLHKTIVIYYAMFIKVMKDK